MHGSEQMLCTVMGWLRWVTPGLCSPAPELLPATPVHPQQLPSPPCSFCSSSPAVLLSQLQKHRRLFLSVALLQMAQAMRSVFVLQR